MKKFYVLIFVIFALSNCVKNEPKPFSLKEKIDLLLPEKFNSDLNSVLESIKFGLSSQGDPTAQRNASVLHLGESLNLSEKSISKLIEELEARNKSGTDQNKVNESLIDTVSTDAQNYINMMFDCFNHIDEYREIKNNVDTFYFASFKFYALSTIYSIESKVVDLNELSQKDKMIILATASTLRSFTTDFETLSLFVLNNYNIQIKGCFFCIIKKVVSAIVSAVVNVVVGAFSGLIYGVDGGPFGMAFCALGGAIEGFFNGLENGIKCTSFDWDCLVTVPTEYGCK